MTPLTTHVLRSDAPSEAQPFTFGPLGADRPGASPQAGETTDGPTPPEGYDEGLAEGLARGRAEGEAERQALREDAERARAELAELHAAADRTADLIATATETLQAAWHDAVTSREADLARLALDAAESVLGAPLSTAQRAAVADGISEAIDSIATGAPISVALHPIDLLHLQEVGLAEALVGSHPGLRWEPDADLAEGDWSVSTPEAAIRRSHAAMVQVLRERMGLS